MSWHGILIGAIAFLMIGLFHPIVIKCEYYFSAKIWPVFLVVGLVLCALSVVIQHIIPSAALAVTGFSALWSIGELKEQEERVRKGWFPANPKRMAKVQAQKSQE